MVKGPGMRLVAQGFGQKDLNPVTRYGPPSVRLAPATTRLKELRALVLVDPLRQLERIGVAVSPFGADFLERGNACCQVVAIFGHVLPRRA